MADAPQVDPLAITRRLSAGAPEKFADLLHALVSRHYDVARDIAALRDWRRVELDEAQLVCLGAAVTLGQRRGIGARFELWRIARRLRTRWGAAILAAIRAAATPHSHHTVTLFAAALDGSDAPEFLRALTHELFARFLRSRGLARPAHEHFLQAIAAYSAWGAAWKATALQQELGEPADEAGDATTSSNTWDAATLDGAAESDLESILTASQALAGDIRRDAILEHLLMLAMNATEARVGAVLVPSPEGFGVAAFATDEARWLASDSPRPWRAVAALAALSEDNLTRREAHLSPSGNAGEMLLVQPVIRNGNLLAVIYLASRDLTPRHAAMAGAIATQAGISFENAALYAELEDKVQQRTRDLEAAQAALVTLERQATEVQMAGGFAHEIRNAVSSARAVVDVILSGNESAGSMLTQDRLGMARLGAALNETRPRPDVAPALDTATDSLARMQAAFETVERASLAALQLTSSVLEYASLVGNEGDTESLDLGRVAAGVAERYATELAAQNITLAVRGEQAALVRGSAAHVQTILTHLLDNARDAVVAARPASGAISINVTRAEHVVSLSVADNGVGIAQQDQQHLFEPFFTTKPGATRGLGLSTVKKLLSLYGASVEVHAAAGAGATFAVKWPAAHA